MKKYELTNHQRTMEDGTVLYQIRSLQETDKILFSRRAEETGEGNALKPGMLGGWVESEKNLSQEGTCWIGRGCMVYGNAVVKDSARLVGKVTLKGSCVAEDYAILSGKIFADGKCSFSGEAVVNVDGRAEFRGNVRIMDFAKIGYDAAFPRKKDNCIQDNILMDGSCKVCHYAKVYQDVRMNGHCEMYNHSELYGHAALGMPTGTRTTPNIIELWDNAKVYGRAVVVGVSSVKDCGSLYGSTFFADSHAEGKVNLCGESTITNSHIRDCHLNKATISNSDIHDLKLKNIAMEDSVFMRI